MAIGVVFGVVASFFAWLIIQSTILSAVKKFFVRFLKPFHFRTVDIVFIAFCAGIGEELLFRASIQPLLGIWLTAFIFVLLHGYLNINNWRLSLYGVFMVLVAAGLGYLYKWVGIVAAIMAHVVIDIALLWFMAGETTTENPSSESADQEDMAG